MALLFGVTRRTYSPARIGRKPLAKPFRSTTISCFVGHANAAQSHFVEMEWTTAYAMKKPILPLKLEAAVLPPSLAPINAVSDPADALKFLDVRLENDADTVAHAETLKKLAAINTEVATPEQAEVQAKEFLPQVQMVVEQHGWRVGNLIQIFGGAFIQGTEKKYIGPCSPPGLIPGYVHRPEIYGKVKGILLESTGGSAVGITTAIKGAGGFGKTTLAKALCNDAHIQERFDDILWVTLGLENVDVNASLTRVVRHLAKDNTVSYPDLQAAEGAFAEAIKDRKCLLVIDDAWKPHQVRPFLAGGSECVRLITTRILDVAQEGESLPVELDEMELDESVQMLTRGLKPSNEELGLLETLADQLGEWPLVLDLVSAVLKKQVNKGKSIETTIAYVTKRWQQKGVAAFDRSSEEGRNAAVALTMAASFDSFDDEDDKDRFLKLGIFPDDTEIPLTVLEKLWDLDEYDTEDVVDRLSEASLIRLHPEREIISLHDVVLAFASEHVYDAQTVHRILTEKWLQNPMMLDSYAWTWMAYHLNKAGKLNQLRTLLTDPAWMQEKIVRIEVQSLIADYDYLKEEEAFPLIQRALRLSLLALRDPVELSQQLRSRLAAIDSPEIITFCARLDKIIEQYPLQPISHNLMPPGGAQLFTLHGHTFWISAVSITQDGNHAVSASNDKTLKVWDLNNGKLLHTLKGHTGRVSDVSITHDDSRAVSASNDKTLKVWDLNNGKLLHTLQGHAARINAVSITQDDSRVVSVSNDKTLKVWDLNNGKLLHTLQGHAARINAVSITQDNSRAVSASNDKTLKVWNLNNGKLLHTLEGHTERINAFSITQDDSRVVSVSSDKTLKVWDLSVGKFLHTLEGDAGSGSTVSITQNGLHAVSISNGGTLKVWDLLTGKLLRSHNDLDKISNVSITQDKVSITKDGNCAVSTSNGDTLKVWDLRTGKLLHTLKGHTGRVKAISITRDGNRVVSASNDNTLKVWDIRDGNFLNTPQGHEGGVSMVLITKDSQRAVSTSNGDTLKVWDLRIGGKLLHTLKGHTDAVRAFSVTEDSNRAVSASNDETLKVWDLNNGRLLHTLKDHTGAVREVSVTKDGQFAVSASEDDTLKAWDLRSGRLLHTWEGQRLSVPTVSITQDGNRAVSVFRDGTFKVWDLASGELLRTLTVSGWIEKISITKDGQFAVSTSGGNTLKVWDLRSGRLLHTLEGQRFQVSAFAITEDGYYAVSASYRTLRVWDLRNGRLLHILKGHKGWVSAVSTTKDGQFAVSVSEDNTLKVWDIRQGQCLASFTGDAPIYCSAFSLNGSVIACGDALGVLHFLRWVPEKA